MSGNLVLLAHQQLSVHVHVRSERRYSQIEQERVVGGGEVEKVREWKIMFAEKSFGHETE